MADTDSFTVGEWLVEPDLGRVSRDSERVALRRQVMDLLVYLADKNGSVATTEELLETLWAGKFVTEGTLYNCVGELRQALGADQTYVETVPRKGYRMAAPVGRPDTHREAGDRHPRKHKALIRIAAVAAVAALIFTWANNIDDRTESAVGAPEPVDNSIAVLPFTDLSADQTNRYVGHGISEALIHQLAEVPNLHVIARTSSFSFQGTNTNVREIGDALNVDSILEGSVQREGDSLRIFAQLIDVASGRHVWSRKFDRDAGSVFGIQDEIALAVAIAISESQMAAEDLAYAALPAPEPVAYELYMQGQYQLNTLFAPGQENTNMDAPRDALEFFSRATEVDPSFALAWAGRARALHMLTLMERMPRVETASLIEEFVGKALRLGPGLAEVQHIAGLFERGEEALEFFDRAIAINPNHSATHVERASELLEMGRYRDAFDATDTAAGLDPLNGVAVEAALYTSFYRGQRDDIEQRISASNRLWPDANGLATEAHLMFELGRFERFPELQRRADTLPGFGVTDWFGSVPRHFGDTYLTLDLEDMAQKWLANPQMVARYDDVMSLYRGDVDAAAGFLLSEIEKSRDRPLHAYRWFPDIVASLVQAYLYHGRHDELIGFFEELGWPPAPFPFPNCCATNPPWPEVAYAHALFAVGREQQAREWLNSMVVEIEHRIEQGIRLPNHYYELARIRVLQGQVSDAFDALETAIDLGWRRWYFELDPILEPVRKLPEFAQVGARYDADIERKRKLVIEERGESLDDQSPVSRTRLPVDLE